MLFLNEPLFHSCWNWRWGIYWCYWLIFPRSLEVLNDLEPLCLRARLVSLVLLRKGLLGSRLLWYHSTISVTGSVATFCSDHFSTLIKRRNLYIVKTLLTPARITLRSPLEIWIGPFHKVKSKFFLHDFEDLVCLPLGLDVIFSQATYLRDWLGPHKGFGQSSHFLIHLILMSTAHIIQAI